MKFTLVAVPKEPSRFGRLPSPNSSVSSFGSLASPALAGRPNPSIGPPAMPERTPTPIGRPPPSNGPSAFPAPYNGSPVLPQTSNQTSGHPTGVTATTVRTPGAQLKTIAPSGRPPGILASKTVSPPGRPPGNSGSDSHPNSIAIPVQLSASFTVISILRRYYQVFTRLQG